MKRARTGETQDDNEVCIVRVSPLGSGAFGEPVGASDKEIGATVARIVHRGMSADDIRETFNRTISYEMVPVEKGDAASFARGFLRGLSYLRTPTVKDTFYAFDANLVRAPVLEAELEPSSISDEDSESSDEPSSEESSSEDEPSTEEEPSDADGDGDFLESGSE